MIPMKSLFDRLRNTRLLRKCAVEAKDSPFTDLNIITEQIGDVRFTCLQGRYEDLVGHPVDPDHFGVNDSEFSRLFGPAAAGTISERIWLIDAHIQHLQLLIEDERRKAVAA